MITGNQLIMLLEIYRGDCFPGGAQDSLSEDTKVLTEKGLICKAFKTYKRNDSQPYIVVDKVIRCPEGDCLMCTDLGIEWVKEILLTVGAWG